VRNPSICDCRMREAGHPDARGRAPCLIASPFCDKHSKAEKLASFIQLELDELIRVNTLARNSFIELERLAPTSSQAESGSTGRPRIRQTSGAATAAVRAIR